MGPYKVVGGGAAWVVVVDVGGCWCWFTLCGQSQYCPLGLKRRFPGQL